MGARLHKVSKYRPSIFQGKLDLFHTPRSVSLTLEHPAERTGFRIVIASLILIASAYVYFVGASVLNVIARKEALLQTARLTGAVSALEREYFLVAKGVTPEAGERLGLAPVPKTAYVRRPGVVGSARSPEGSRSAAHNEI